MKPKIKTLIQTCQACPSQWEGVLEDGRDFYIRFRWGYLSFRVAAEDDHSKYAAVNGEEILGINTNDEWNGVLPTSEMLNLIADKVERN